MKYVPQKERHASMSMAYFLGKVIFKYAETHAITNVRYLEKWLIYAFPENMRTRISFLLNAVKSTYPSAGIHDILRELAIRLEPDSYSSIENIEKRKADETIVDFTIRLCSDWAIFETISPDEKYRKILKFIIQNGDKPRNPLLVVHDQDPARIRKSVILSACLNSSRVFILNFSTNHHYNRRGFCFLSSMFLLVYTIFMKDTLTLTFSPII